MAPATAPGVSAVSIVRLSGPAAFAVAAGMTGQPEPLSLLPRTLTRATLVDRSGAAIDDALVAFFPGPRSFTGEDIVEFQLHGNPRIVSLACDIACALGAVPAEAGEFSRRAFLNGKLDLTQAEGVADLIVARSEGAVRAALSQLRGGIGRQVEPLRDRMLHLLTMIEGAIDFSEEEDVPEAAPETLRSEIRALRAVLGTLLASWRTGHRMRDGATVVIAGVANVGKSLLLNRLLGEERAIVAPVPGTTRDYLAGEVELAGFPVRFVDTAGLRATDDPVEAEGVRRSRELVAVADLVLFVLDGSRTADAGDRAAYDSVGRQPHFLLVNKSDLAGVEDGAGFAGAGLSARMRVSARTGNGIEALRKSIGAALFPADDTARAEAPLTRLRHRDAVARADEALARAEAAISRGLPMECIGADVRDAARAMAELTGAIAPGEVLDTIFDSFCIGK
ncbi:MAG TPA: tRNA uridine-5-carboxymethylaminomethyl(34) synthesis GTPase MnmE [Candidatus Deferrimicrobiaceae bacterium]